MLTHYNACMHYIQFVYFCVYCFAFRTPPLHLHHVQVRARTIQPLSTFSPISPEVHCTVYHRVHCTVYHRFIIPEYYNLHIIIIIIIIVCIYTSLRALHMYIHVCILFCIQETTTTLMPCSSQSTDDSMAVVGLPPNWTDVSFGALGLHLCRVTYQELPGTAPLVVTHSLIVKQDCSWALNVHGHTVD